MTSLARFKASVLNNLSKGLSGEQGKGEYGALKKGEVTPVSSHVDNSLTIMFSATQYFCSPYRSVVHLLYPMHFRGHHYRNIEEPPCLLLALYITVATCCSNNDVTKQQYPFQA